MTDKKPIFYIIAGANGSGKSTFVDQILRGQTDNDVNIDRIEKSGVTGVDALGKAIREVKENIKVRNNFSYETVLSTVPKSIIKSAQKKGYEVHFIFLALGDERTNIQRVKERVAKGGHNIPEAQIKERVPKAFKNALETIKIADQSYIYDNSLEVRQLLFIENPHKRFMYVENLPEWAGKLSAAQKEVQPVLGQVNNKEEAITLSHNSKGVNHMSNDKPMATDLDAAIENVQQREILISYDAKFNSLVREKKKLSKTVNETTSKLDATKTQFERSLGIIFEKPEEVKEALQKKSQNKEGNVVMTRYANNVAELITKPKEYGKLRNGAEAALKIIATQGLDKDLVETAKIRAEAGKERNLNSFKTNKQMENSYKKAKDFGLEAEFKSYTKTTNDKQRFESPMVENYLKSLDELKQATKAAPKEAVEKALRASSEKVGKPVELKALLDVHPKVQHMKSFVENYKTGNNKTKEQNQTKSIKK